MKKVVLITGSRYQPNACGFIEEFEKLNGKMDGILCLQTPRNLKFYLKKIFQVVKIVKPSKIKDAVRFLICKLYNKQPLHALKQRWNNTGENSWDLLQNKFDIFQYAKMKNIPLQLSPSLSPAVIGSYTKSGPVIFPMYAGGIITKEILNNTLAEFINAHMGEMPRYRGMNVIEWAVLENQQPKVAVMVLNEVIDGGDVIWHKEIPFENEKTVADLRKKGYIYCYKAMAEGVFNYQGNESLRQKQSKGGRFYYRLHGRIRKMIEGKLQS